jgi:hypothetical protein
LFISHYNFFLFLMYWSLNSGPCTYYTGALPLCQLSHYSSLYILDISSLSCTYIVNIFSQFVNFFLYGYPLLHPIEEIFPCSKITQMFS